ncbi:MAG: hypothetical protein ABL867_08360 [Rickettsiales bacterium]
MDYIERVDKRRPTLPINITGDKNTLLKRNALRAAVNKYGCGEERFQEHFGKLFDGYLDDVIAAGQDNVARVQAKTKFDALVDNNRAWWGIEDSIKLAASEAVKALNTQQSASR